MGGAESQAETSPILSEYKDWDDFCVKALDEAKKQSVSDVSRGAVYLRKVLESMITVIQWAGWQAITAILVSTGVAAAGATIAAMAAALINPVIAVGALAGGVALTAAVGVIYYNKSTVQMAKDILEGYHDEFDLAHPPASLGNVRELRRLHDESIKKLAIELFGKRILSEDVSVPQMPVCLCGTSLKSALADKCYESEWPFVICDVCNQRVPKDVDVYHCPNEYTEVHSRGFDVCIQCARKFSDQLNRFHALIIESEPKLRDRFHWQKCFKDDLNYHSVSVIDPSESTLENIRTEMQGLAEFTENDTIVVCLGGHGEVNPRNGQFYFRSADGEKISSSKMIEWLSPVKKIKEASEDGTRLLHVDISYKQRDVVFFINACHSGAFVTGEEEKTTEDDWKRKRKEEGARARIDQVLKHYRQSLLVISSCAAREESMGAVGKVDEEKEADIADGLNCSPFVRYVIQALKSEDSKLSALQVFEHVILKASTDESQLGATMHQLGQNPGKAVETGFFADSIRMKPVVSSYE